MFKFSKIKIFIICISFLSLFSCKEKENMIRTGQVEMRHYDIASKVPGRIEYILVDEGDLVDTNQILFKISDKELVAKLGQAEGAIESANAQFEMSKNGARNEQIKMAEQAVDGAKSQYHLAKQTFDRIDKMHQEKLVSDQDYDVTLQKVNAAKAQLDAASYQLDMLKNGSRIEEKKMAEGQLKRARKSAEEVNSYLDETLSRSFISGIIAKRYLDKGELVSVGYPVVTIIDPTDSWVELNLPESELKLLKIGDVLKGKINGLGVDEDFKIVSFSSLSDFANWRTNNDKNTFEIRSFTVKLKPVKVIKEIRPGMTVSFNLFSK